MLSATHRPVIEATLPVVAEHLDEITTRFYAGMFAARPELLNGMFSRANQRKGEQPKALARSIAHFASHLVNDPDTPPATMLARVAHKHVSLGVTADQYRIVHEHLFAAIAEVLGEAVTPEVAEAWNEVYWLMADTLVDLEAGLYAQTPARTPGDVWSRWTLSDRIESAPGTWSLLFTPTDPDLPQMPAAPGQYVSVRVPAADGLLQCRQYTLSGAPEATSTRTITVRRDSDGEVSPVLVDGLAVGDSVEISHPCGDLTVETAGTRPLVLATAGIGCTPAAAALDALRASDSRRPVLALHVDRSPEHWALATQMTSALRALPDARLVFWSSRLDETDLPTAGAPFAPEAPGPAPEHRPSVELRHGRMDLAGIPVPEGAQIHLCGPDGFMQDMHRVLVARRVAPEDISMEVFGPDTWTPTARRVVPA
ncbi:globin domain-containing protein [Brevibacterium litoralis]|uniref:globin domain-containing protein n=1 Tax=Brevibacterium litoralis TaxID=3138935 RepID=UPI0032EC7352